MNNAWSSPHASFFFFLLLLSKFSELPSFYDVLKTKGNKGKSEKIEKSATLWPPLSLLHFAAKKKLKAKLSQSWNTKIFHELKKKKKKQECSPQICKMKIFFNSILITFYIAMFLFGSALFVWVCIWVCMVRTARGRFRGIPLGPAAGCDLGGETWLFVSLPWDGLWWPNPVVSQENAWIQREFLEVACSLPLDQLRVN